MQHQLATSAINRWLVAGGLIWVGGCRDLGAQHLEASTPTPLRDERIPFLTEGTPGDVLGHRVQRGNDRLLLVDPNIDSACAVSVEERKVNEVFRSTRAVSKVGGVNLGFSVFSLGVDLAASSEVTYDFQTTRVLTAHAVGECGDEVIRRAYMGRGSLSFRDVGRVRLGAGTQTVGAFGGRSVEEGTRLSFEDERIYAVEIGMLAPGQDPLEIQLQLPPELEHGDGFEVSVYSNRPCYVLVAFVAPDGNAYLIAPSAAVPSPRVEAVDRPFTYPTPAALADGLTLQAILPDDATEARESAVAYCFEDESDLRAVAPLSTLVREYSIVGNTELERRLRTRLSALPSGKWGRATFSYWIRR